MTRARERGTCTNTSTFPLRDIERYVIDGLRHELHHPSAIKHYVKIYNEERARKT